ncbi:MAG TPA: glycosyl hydrolase family 28-related protein, partial [Planctomycetota bacterium]|nr:glycosyl hydrolase family 28-related protein [Planctomycetota bacterium]
MRGPREATRVAALLLALVNCRAAWAQPPVISYVTQPVRHWETFFLFGEGFGAGNVKVLRGEIRDERSPEQLAQAIAAGEVFTPPAAPPEGVGDLYGRQFVLTSQVIGGKLQGAVQVFWVKTSEGVSRPYVVNRPEPFFAEFDEVAPGQECRLFGRNMVQSLHPPAPTLWLIDRAAKRAFACEWGNRFDYQGHLNYQLPYELRFKVPDAVPDGAYELWVHNGLKTGLHGFGGPMPLAVTRAKPSERKRLDVRDFGARGDGRADDAAAIERAALAAADDGGAVVFLPQGDYVLSRTVRVPPGVDLEGFRPELSRLVMRPEAQPFSPDLPKEPLRGKGEDWSRHFRRLEGPPMVYLVSNSRVENLGFVAVEPACWAIAAARVQGAIERIVIRHCDLVNSHAPWVSGKWRPGTACIGLLGYARFCEICGCSLKGMNGIGHVGTGYRCRTIANTFSPIGGSFGTTGMGWMIGVECLIEGNVCDGSNRGFTCGPWMGPIERNFIARNGVVNGGSVEGGAESFLFEGPDVGRENWLGHPSAAGADWLEQADQKWKPDVLKGRVALVVHGRGFGQWRRVAANTGNRVTLAEPWAVPPDQTSLV